MSTILEQFIMVFATAALCTFCVLLVVACIAGIVLLVESMGPQ